MAEIILRAPAFFIDRLGASILHFNKRLHQWFDFTEEFLKALFSPPLRVKEVIEQIYEIGFKSMPVILFSVSFAAAVTVIEYSYHIKLVIQTASLVPGFAALLVLRELGAVITALLLTSRVGAGITAEIGTMKITEQIDALKLLNVDPMKYLSIPRFIGSIISCVLLVIFANATCLFFTMLVSMSELNFTWEAFLHAMNQFATFKDFGLSLIKAAVFGAVIPFTSCFYGLHCDSGAEGVGAATTRAVVTNAVAIIFIDFLLTYLFSYIY